MKIINHDWSDVINCTNIDEKVSTFHNVLGSTLNKYFPQKSVKISSMDKK